LFRFVDILVELLIINHCLEVIVCFVDIGGIVDHHCFRDDCFVEIGGIVDIPSISTKRTITSKAVMVNDSTNIYKTNNHL
jgi:hypothetical protein